jgi:hypothetical protein
VQLPLEALPALGEYAYLARDQIVEVGTLEPTEIAIDDEAASSQTEETKERSVPFGASSVRQRVVHVVTKLRVVGDEQLGHVGHERTLTLERLAKIQPSRVVNDGHARALAHGNVLVIGAMTLRGATGNHAARG